MLIILCFLPTSRPTATAQKANHSRRARCSRCKSPRDNELQGKKGIGPAGGGLEQHLEHSIEYSIHASQSPHCWTQYGRTKNQPQVQITFQLMHMSQRRGSAGENSDWAGKRWVRIAFGIWHCVFHATAHPKTKHRRPVWATWLVTNLQWLLWARIYGVCVVEKAGEGQETCEFELVWVHGNIVKLRNMAP